MSKKLCAPNKNFIGLSFFIILFALFCLSCIKEKEHLLTKVTIAQWGQEKYLIYLPVYLAIETGFFKEEGIEITIKFSGNDDQTFATVIKGDAEFGVGDPVFTAISRERGFKGKVVASIVDGVAIWGLTNNSKIKFIKKPSDLAGLTVGTFPEPSTNYTLMKKTIIEGGKELENTKIKQAPIGAQIALLESGEADIAMELEPATSLSVSKGYRVVYSSPKFYGPFSFTGLTTTEDLIQRNRQLIQKVVNSIEKAIRYAHSDFEGTVATALKLFPTLNESVVRMAVKRMVDEKTLPEHARVSDEAWQKALKVRIIVGDLKKQQPTSDSVDNSFAEEAMKIVR